MTKLDLCSASLTFGGSALNNAAAESNDLRLGFQKGLKILKIALLGQNIPTLLPNILVDLLFACHENGDIYIDEKADAMQDLLKRYSEAVISKSGINASVTVTSNRQLLLENADVVIYDGDVMPGSCFLQDREALSSPDEDDDNPDAGLTDQARVNGGIGGLMHTFRQGKVIYNLCQDMKLYCSSALVITLAQPVGRCVEMFEKLGFTAYGLDKSPVKGAGGLEGICSILHKKVNEVEFSFAGLPSFEFVTKLNDAASGTSLIENLKDAVSSGSMGRLAMRWLDFFDEIPVGDMPAHAEYMAAQPDFIPAEKPVFGETVEQRKERILYMNKVADEYADVNSKEGSMAQLLLISKVSPLRPIQLAVSIVKRLDINMKGVCRKNNGLLPQMPDNSIVTGDFTIDDGKIVTNPVYFSDELTETLIETDYANSLAAAAALGNRSALRELLECDPALEGLDRIYCQELVENMIKMQGDLVLSEEN